MKISKRNLFKMKKKMSWMGTGTQDNPIVVDSIKSPREWVWIGKISHYLIIRNITVERITMEKCKNVTIENCKIYDLWIHTSSNILIKNNFIHYFALDETKSSSIEYNKFHKTFANIVSIQDETEHVSKVVDLYCIGFIMCLISIALLFLSIALISEMVFNIQVDPTYIVMVIAPIGGSIVPIIYLILRRKEKKELNKLSPNTIQNNESQDLNEMFKNFVRN